MSSPRRACCRTVKSCTTRRSRTGPTASTGTISPTCSSSCRSRGSPCRACSAGRTSGRRRPDRRLTAAHHMKAPTTLELTWDRELVFHGVSADARITLDSAGKVGPSPVQALAFALAGCMGMDVVHILRKGRYDLRGLKVSLVAQRAEEDPHRI